MFAQVPPRHSAEAGRSRRRRREILLRRAVASAANNSTTNTNSGSDVLVGNGVMAEPAASPFLTSNTTPASSLAQALAAAGPSSVEGFRSPTRSRAGSDRAPSLTASSPRTVPLGPPPSDFVPTSPVGRLPLHVGGGPYGVGHDPREAGGAHELGPVDVSGSPTGHHPQPGGVHGLGFGTGLKRAPVDPLSGGRGAPLARIDAAWPAHRPMPPPPRPNSTPIHQTEFAPIEAQRRTSLADGMYGYRAEVPMPNQFGQSWLTGHQRAPIMAPAPGLTRGSPVMNATFGSPVGRGVHTRTPSIASSSGAATAPGASLRHPPSEPKTGDQPALLRTTQIPSGPGPSSSSSVGAGLVAGAVVDEGDDAGSVSTPVPPLFANRAVLNLQGDLGSMAMGWTPEEWSARRRLVQFWRKQDANTINTTFTPIAPHQFVPNSIVVSCIFREERNECYITSVDTIYLLEALVGVRFTVEEKNRIRRNLEGFRPMTVSKNKADSENFFKLIMSFPNPKPRNIEKDVKVFQWKNLASALQKILSKYSATYHAADDAGNASAAVSTNPSGAPSVTGSAGEDESPLSPHQVPPAVGPEAAGGYAGPADAGHLLHQHAVTPIVPHPPTDASVSPVASPTMPSHPEAGAHHYMGGPYEYGMVHHAVPPPFARAAPAHGFVVDPDAAGHARTGHHAYPVPYPMELAGLPPGYAHPHHQHSHHHHNRSMSDGDTWAAINHRPESGIGPPTVDDYGAGPSAAGGPGGGAGPFAAYDTSPPTAHPEFYSQEANPIPSGGHHPLLEERRGSAPAFRTGPWRSFAFDGSDATTPVPDHPEINGHGGTAEGAAA